MDFRAYWGLPAKVFQWSSQKLTIPKKLFAVFHEGSWAKFLKGFSCEQKKKIQYNLWHKI